MADNNKENECLLDSQINTLTVNQLKEYLRRYNQNVTGKKAELVLRAKGDSVFPSNFTVSQGMTLKVF